MPRQDDQGPTCGESGIDKLVKLSSSFRKVNSISKEDLHVELKDLKLEHLYKVLDGSNYNSKSIILKNFFEGDEYSCLAEEMDFYNNNIIQFSQDDFFKSKNMSKVAEMSNGYHGETVPNKGKSQCDLNKYFTIFNDAILLYSETCGQGKIAIELEYDRYSRPTYYTIYSNNDIGSLWSELKEYCKVRNPYKNKKIDANCNFLDINKDIGWDDIIIDPAILKVIKSNVSNLFAIQDILLKNKISLKRGIILAGKPGTGKTLMCKILAKETLATILYVLPSHIKGIADISRICKMAKDLSPTLMIIEDIDFLAEDREESGNWSVVELMNHMDGLEDFDNVVTLATTNMVDKVEKAIKNRPGRFDRIIDIPLPDKDIRKRMIENFCSDFKLKDVDIAAMSEKTDKLTGAYIKDLCITAALMAIQDNNVTKAGKATITNKYFEEAFEEIKNKDFTRLMDTGFNKKRLGFQVPI